MQEATENIAVGKQEKLQSEGQHKMPDYKGSSEHKRRSCKIAHFRQQSSASTSRESDDIKLSSYKMQKRQYRDEKKKVAQELLCALKDPTIVIMADWLKIRSTLRKWSRLYCVLKPGLLLLYKSPKTHKQGYWVGTVLLNSCELIERPSKKSGFCFKLFNCMNSSIWATRGPLAESLPAVTMPLPASYLICRASDQDSGRCWMDALELALRCSRMLIKTMNKELYMESRSGAGDSDAVSPTAEISNGNLEFEDSLENPQSQTFDEKEAERHFVEDGLEDDENEMSEPEILDDVCVDANESRYVAAPPEVFGALGDSEQTEEIAEENKSLIWMLMKQVRPGMDLSKVVLPTFILEARSFLEKLTDFNYHADLMETVVQENDPYKRILAIVKFYISGFYKKPKGLKKPYNPIIGEIFRCYWRHSDGSRTFYIAEQVSHHPPVSAFFVSNRKVGFNISGTILAKSKFYGNSLSAVMNGNVNITLLSRGETYVLSLPYAHCKGLILGTLTMELGGIVTIKCDRTGYSAQIEFKLKPFFGSNDLTNSISGKIKLGNETMAEIEGHWDGSVFVTSRGSQESELLWQPTSEVKERRLPRFVIPVEEQADFESEKLWMKVSEAILAADQEKATEAKTFLEEQQRRRAKELKERDEIHCPRLFEFDSESKMWLYKYSDYRPWDHHSDLEQFEKDMIIQTRVMLRTPKLRVTSLSTTIERAEPGKPVDAGRPRAESLASSASEQSSNNVESQPTQQQRKDRRHSLHANDEILRQIKESVDEMNRRLASVQYKLEFNHRSRCDGLKFYEWLLIIALFGVAQAVLIYAFYGGFGF